MGTEAPMKRNQNLNDIMKRSSSSNSESLNHLDSPHSPLRFHSPLRSDQGDPDPPEPDNPSPPYASPAASPGKPPVDNSKALVVVVDKSTQLNANYSPFPSPPPRPTTPPQQSSHFTVNRAIKEEAPGVSTRTKAGGGGGARAVAQVLRRSKVRQTVEMAAFAFRLSEVVLCLISFSVMAADKTQGWSGDSFDRYKEYRYCLSVTVIGFVYAGFQAFDLAYYLITEAHVFHHYLRQPLSFSMDQMLAYLLISASSAAATRVDDWQSNWGKDGFTEMASASVAMAFLAFIAFAFSSLISGYELCTHESP
ncbi:PREDICTED: CASP-like protein 4A2 [Theobroma cacao]|uniref:CASP-like protein n=1 Tax=Theobroma cacao TaxID=3641 RepID=A0AB32W8T3_THECC|nr:PREDICTED: CASP-like protein 4A2 [Theobroma cacao]